jgi:hypothetical protein
VRPAWYALLILGVVAYQVITRLARRGGGPQIGPHERGWWLNPLIVAVVLFALV